MTECSECPGLFSLFLPLLDDFSLSEHCSHLYLYLLDKSRQHVPVNKRVSLKDTLLGSLRNTSGTKGVGPTGNQQSWSHRSKETIPSLVRKTGISQCAIPTAGKKCPGQNCECDSRGTLISPSGHCPPWRAAQSGTANLGGDASQRRTSPDSASFFFSRGLMLSHLVRNLEVRGLFS